MKQYVKKLIVLGILLLGIGLSSANVNAATKKGKVYLSKTSENIDVNGTTSIKIKKQSGVKIIKKTFKSENKKIATVNSKGKVKGIKSGKTKIKVKVKYSYKKSGVKKTTSKTLKYTITINTKKDNTKKDDTKNDDNKKDNNVTPPNTTITFGQASYTVKEGETIKIDVKAPEGAQLEWSLSNAIDVIDQDGNLTGCGGLFKNARYIIVKDKVSGAEAKCPYTVETCKYQSPYNYEVAIMGEPMIGGTIVNNNMTLYVKTNNPGDRYIYFDFVVDGVDRNKLNNTPFESNFITFDDIECSKISVKKTKFDSDEFSNKFTSINGGYLFVGGISAIGSANSNGGWTINDIKETYEYMATSGGKATLILYEYNPNIKASNFTSVSAKRTVVWQKNITLKNYYEELNEWIDNTFIPSAEKNKSWNSDYERMSILCEYFRKTTIRYAVCDFKSADNMPHYFLCENASNIFWNIPNCNYADSSRDRFPSPRFSSQSGPVIMQYILNHLGYNCVIEHCKCALVIDGQTTSGVRADPDANVALENINIEKHNIDYFLNLYGSSLMASDPITME